MIKLIRKLFGLCEHRWLNIKEVQDYSCSFDDKRPSQVIVIQQCEKCGKLHNHYIKP